MMNRAKYFFILLLLFSAKVVACKCVPLSIDEQYEKSDLVILASTTEEYLIGDDRSYLAKYLVHETFKGNHSHNNSEILLDVMFSTSCEAPSITSPRVMIIIFANDRGDGIYQFSRCAYKLVQKISSENQDLGPDQEQVESILMRLRQLMLNKSHQPTPKTGAAVFKR